MSERTNKPYDMAKTPWGEVPLPYDNRFTFDVSGIDLQGDPSVDPMKPAHIAYKKRDGGVYIYSNNAEMMRQGDVNSCILRNEELTGDVEFTYEHSNHSDQPVYLGYRLTNTGDTDVEVLVTNVGIQVQGEWLGQQSWSDFYNVHFTMPSTYFNEDGSEYFGYVGQDFIEYTPRVFMPTTYTLPAGQYMYVLGGTSADAYNNYNVADTADQPILVGRCSNGAVKFRVSGGKVTGNFFCYTDASKIGDDMPEQGYLVWRDEIFFGGQYKGIDPALGLAEADVSWTVNDKTPAGRLPVEYTNYYDEKIDSYPKTPYMTYHSTPHHHECGEWMTALNPQSHHGAVGDDMMIFRCIREDGTPVIIDNEHADGNGDRANTGNWMMQYNNNFTLINTGDKARTFRLYSDGALLGALFVLVRNEAGDVLNTRCTVRPICHPTDKLPESADRDKYEHAADGWSYPLMPDGRSYRLHKPEEALMAEVTVAPHSIERVTIDYNILGNSCGGVLNWVELD